MVYYNKWRIKWQKKKNKIKFDRKELIVTIVVLIAAIILGFIAGKSMFDSLH